ncbi:hypothetical protein QTP70_011957 [Hemibagrus guttatus]|uniref:Reverse transcriptase domain-containing protein n=1 Tax=Hemibagrus guttatus TaxID=175788 RepID=A0AAE0Q9Y8_9TELE|nr:hypothetical protein QTP70_011957 [Hemibagrus guttatus]
MCFVDLEKAFYCVPRGILWEVLWEYGVRGPLLRAVWSLYNRSRILVHIASCKSDLFPVHVGLRQGCPLSPVLFIVFMDRISRRSQGLEGVWFGYHRISSLIFADDVVLLAPSSLDIQHALGCFAAECEAAGMRVSTSKSEAMVLNQKKVACTIQVGGEILPQVEEFKYLGVLFTTEGRMDHEIDRRIGAAAAVMRSIYWSVVVKKELSRKAKLSIYQSVYLPTLTYGHELWVMTERVAEMFLLPDLVLIPDPILNSGAGTALDAPKHDPPPWGEARNKGEASGGSEDQGKASGGSEDQGKASGGSEKQERDKWGEHGARWQGQRAPRDVHHRAEAPSDDHSRAAKPSDIHCRAAGPSDVHCRVAAPSDVHRRATIPSNVQRRTTAPSDKFCPAKARNSPRGGRMGDSYIHMDSLATPE